MFRVTCPDTTRGRYSSFSCPLSLFGFVHKQTTGEALQKPVRHIEDASASLKYGGTMSVVTTKQNKNDKNSLLPITSETAADPKF